MGYWNAVGPNSDLFGHAKPEEVTGVWGDTPADIIGDALDAIVEAFQEDLGRMPTKEEIANGLMFSLRCRDEIPDK
jgi:hypothetical protein